MVPFVALTLVASCALGTVGILRDYPSYAIVMLAVAPAVPLITREAARALRVNTWLAVFGAITVLQVGHLGEHSMQVLQLTISGGDLARSHGVFGQLDFETVHFLWDTGVWTGTLLLLWRFGRQNAWLWVSLLFASLHELEHMYLFTVYVFEPDFYHHGGFAGVLGAGGIVPTVERPYLHFGYNFMVVVPMVIAFLKQCVRAARPRETGRALGPVELGYFYVDKRSAGGGAARAKRAR